MTDAKRLPPCPICKRPAAPDCRPFCSRRCADVDLGRWFTEGYRVPAPMTDESESEPEAANDPHSSGQT